jgi:charged multivesicular body protein 4
MNWLFGKKQNEIKVKKETENRANKSIEKMNNTIELLEKRQKLLQKKMEQETERAKAFLQKGNKAAAAQCLKNKKQHQAQFDKLSSQIANMMTMVSTLEGAATDVETLKANQEAAKSLKEIYKEVGGVEKVEDIFDDVRDTMDRANELSAALSQPLGDPAFEDDIDAELEALEESALSSQLNELDKPSKVKPTKAATTTVATTTKAKAKSAEEDELSQLEAELNAA